MRIRSFHIASMLFSISVFLVAFASIPPWFEYMHKDEYFENRFEGYLIVLNEDISDDLVIPIFILIFSIPVFLIITLVGSYLCINWKGHLRSPKKTLLFQLVPASSMIATILISWAIMVRGFGYGYEIISPYLSSVSIVLFSTLFLSFIANSYCCIYLILSAYNYRTYAYDKSEKIPRKRTILMLTGAAAASAFVPPLFLMLLDGDNALFWGPAFIMAGGVIDLIALVLLASSSTNRSFIERAERLVRDGRIEQGAGMMRKAGLYEKAGHFYSSIGKYDLAAECYEKVDLWEDARTCRSCYKKREVIDMTGSPFEIEVHGLIKNKRALIISGTYFLLTLVILGMLFMPGWLSYKVDESYESEWPTVERIDFRMEMYEGLYRSSGELEVHAYDENGNEVFTEDGDVPSPDEDYVFKDNYVSWDEKVNDPSYEYDYELYYWFYVVLYGVLPLNALFIVIGSLVAFGRWNGRLTFFVNLIPSFILGVLLFYLMTRLDEGGMGAGPFPEMNLDLSNSGSLGLPFYLIFIALIGMIICSLIMVPIGNYRKKLYYARSYAYSMNLKKAQRLYKRIKMDLTSTRLMNLASLQDRELYMAVELEDQDGV